MTLYLYLTYIILNLNVKLRIGKISKDA